MSTEIIVSEEYTRAVTLTRSIIANAQAAQQSLYEVCKGLYDMREQKLYKELGYSNFENYCENEVGIARRQGGKYAMIGSALTEENAQSTAHFEAIGTEKLYLLAKLDEPTREAVTETVDVESVTVKELQAQIKTLTAERDTANASLESKDKQFKSALDSKQHEIDELRTDGKRRTDTLIAKIQKLQADLDEARSTKEQVAVEDTSRIETLEKELAECKRQLAARPMVQDALPTAYADHRRGEFRAISDSVTAVLEQLVTFLDENDNCSEFRSFANRAKDKLREYNTRINNMIAEEESTCQSKSTLSSLKTSSASKP